MKKNSTKKLSQTNWDKIDAMTDEDIDYSDSEEMTEEFFKIAFIRKPTHKKPVSLRLDMDIIEFFKKISADTLTPVQVFLKIKAQLPDHIFLFESAENDQKKGRFSIIGCMPDLVWKCHNDQALVNNNFTIPNSN